MLVFVNLKNLNKKIVNAINQLPESASATETTGLNTILTRFQQRLSGIGTATRNGKKIQIKVSVKPNATPIAQKARRILYHLVEPLKKRIEEFEANDIIEPVPKREAVKWYSPLVVPTRQVQAPITEDFSKEFKDV